MESLKLSTTEEGSYSTSLFLQDIATITHELKNLSVPDEFRIVRPFDSDNALQNTVSNIKFIYDNLLEISAAYMVYLSQHLFADSTDAEDALKNIIIADRNADSFLNSLNYYEHNKDAIGPTVYGFYIYNLRVSDSVPKEECYKNTFASRESAIAALKKIGEMKVHRDEHRLEELFEEKLRGYCSHHHYDAFCEYIDLRKKLPKDTANAKFLGDTSRISIIRLFDRYKGDIAKMVNDVKRKKIREDDLPKLLDYVMRKRIIAQYLNRDCSQNSVIITNTTSINYENLPAFAQYVVNPIYAPFTIEWLHIKFDKATRSEPVFRVLDDICDGKHLCPEIPLSDLTDEFPRLAKIITSSNYSKKVGESSPYRKSGQKGYAGALDSYIKFCLGYNKEPLSDNDF